MIRCRGAKRQAVSSTACNCPRASPGAPGCPCRPSRWRRIISRGGLHRRQELRTFGSRDDDGSNRPEDVQERAQYDCEQLHKMILLQFADSVGLFIALPLCEARVSMPQVLSVKEDCRRHPQAHGRPVSRRQTQKTRALDRTRHEAVWSTYARHSINDGNSSTDRGARSGCW